MFRLTLEQIDKETVRLEEALRNHSLKTPHIVATIIKKCLDNQLPNEHFEKPVRILAEYMKDASIYKKRRLGMRISKLDLVPRIIICRELASMGVQHFSLDLCMSKSGWNPRLGLDEVMKFQKPTSCIVMAFGDNSYGKLGIGSDVDRVDILTPVQLPERVVNVVMSHCHSIFVTSSGDVYGSGRTANFMEGAQNSEENILTPVKIPFSRVDPNKTSPHIVLTEKCTKILDYTDTSYLVIGGFDPGEDAVVLSEGENWKVIEKNHIFDNQISKEIENKSVVMETHNGKRREMTVREDGAWIGNFSQKTEIAFLVDGFRVNSEKFWKKYHVTKNGEIYAVADGNVYKGKLMMVPRGLENDGDDDMDENDQDTGDDDVQVLPRDDVMLAVMEEMALPMGYNDMQCTFNGDAYMLYNRDLTARFCEKLPRFRPEAMYDDFCMNHDCTLTFYHGPRLLSIFKGIRERLDIKIFPDWYSKCGLPIEAKYVRGLLALEHLLRIDMATGLTKVFVDNITDDDDLDVEGVRKEMQMAYKMGNKIPVLVVEAGWTKEEFQNRAKQIRNKVREFVVDLLDRVQRLLEKLNKVPLKYRKNMLDGRFGAFVNEFLEFEIFDNGFEDALRLDITAEPPNGEFDRNHCYNAMRQRSANKDLDGEEDRWNLVRVEALPVEYTQSEDVNYYTYNIHTTKFHIKCVAPELLDRIDGNNVLNLNVTCLHDRSPNRFIQYIDSFFLINDSEVHLKTFERKIDVIAATESLPDCEKYTVTTSDGHTLKVPKVLFEVFSEFDAGRKRMCSRTGEDVDHFHMTQVTAEGLKLLLACLIDVRVFYKANMDLKMQVYQATQYYLFEHLHTEMLRMIVETAEEQDHAYIAQLISQNIDGTVINLIAKHRSDILILWKNIPIHGNYLPTLSKIAAVIQQIGFNRVPHMIGNECVPIIATKDSNVDKEKISHRFMKKLISNHDRDEDVNIDLVKTLLAWDPDNPQSRKRPWPFEAAQGIYGPIGF